MGKGDKLQIKTRSQTCRISPFPLSSFVIRKKKGCEKSFERKYWDEASCSVCMEVPHNAVLLLCSSHDKGCRPFMCATSCRHSNCLEQYKKAYMKADSSQNVTRSHGSFDDSNFTSALNYTYGKTEVSNLLCPLCRGKVKGWTVVKPARKYLNAKKRTCMQDNCLFQGSYKELKKHVRAEHPRACPRDVDPVLTEKWKKLENDRALDDVFSTIRSTMPGAIIMGDYVIERTNRRFPRAMWMT